MPLECMKIHENRLVTHSLKGVNSSVYCLSYEVRTATLRRSRERSLPARRAAGPGTRGWGGEGKGERGTGGHRHLPPQPCSHPPPGALSPALIHPPLPLSPARIRHQPRAPGPARPLAAGPSAAANQKAVVRRSRLFLARTNRRARTRALCVGHARSVSLGDARSVSDTRALCLSGARARRGGAWAGCGKAAPRPRCRAPPLREERGEPDPDPTAPGSSEGNWGMTGEKCCVKQINK